MNFFKNLVFVNLNRLLLLLIAVTLIILTGCNYFESEQTKINNALNLYNEAHFYKSIILTKKILQSNPKSCEARILLGKNQFAMVSFSDALESFNKVKQLGCKSNQLFPYYVKTLLYLNRLDEAKALYSDPGFNSDINKPENILLEGDIYFVQKNYEKAKEFYTEYYTMTHNLAENCLSQTKLSALKNDYQKVLQNSSTCEETYTAKDFNIDQSRYLRAIAYINTKANNEAISTLNTLLSGYSNKKDPNLKIQASFLLMRLFLAEKDIDNASIMADKLLKFVAAPEIYHVKGLKAERDKHYDIAEQQFLAALKLNPRYKPSLMELANLKYKEGNVEQARYYAGKIDSITGKNEFSERLEDLLSIKYMREGDLDAIINKLPHDKNSDSLQSKYILALAYAKKGDSNNTWKIFGELEKKIGNSETSELLKARLYMVLGENNSAEDIFNKYVKKDNEYAMLGLSQLYIQETRYDVAESLLKKGLNNKQIKYNATLLLAELYSKTDRKEKIIDLLNQQIHAEPKNTAYKLLLARVYYNFKNYQNAINLSNQIINSSNDNGAYIIKANSYIRLNDISNAKLVLNDLVKSYPKNAYAYLMLAYIANKESDNDSAMSYVDKALAQDPLYINAIYAKLQLLLEQKKSQDALDFAKSSSALFNENSIKNMLFGFVYSKIGDKKNAYLNYTAALNSGVQDIRVALRVYGLSHELNGETQAVNELDRFLGNHHKPENAFYAANYFMKQKNFDLAEKYYELLVKENKNNAVVFNNLAWLKLHRNENQAALDYANKALALAPHSAAIMDTMGQVLLQLGEYDKAGSYLLTASQKLTNNPGVKYHLALFYYHKNNLEKSKNLLSEIENSDFEERSAAKELLMKINNNPVSDK